MIPLAAVVLVMVALHGRARRRCAFGRVHRPYGAGRARHRRAHPDAAAGAVARAGLPGGAEPAAQCAGRRRASRPSTTPLGCARTRTPPRRWLEAAAGARGPDRVRRARHQPYHQRPRGVRRLPRGEHRASGRPRGSATRPAPTRRASLSWSRWTRSCAPTRRRAVSARSLWRRTTDRAFRPAAQPTLSPRISRTCDGSVSWCRSTSRPLWTWSRTDRRASAFGS